MRQSVRKTMMLAASAAAFVALQATPALAACRDPWINTAIYEWTGKYPTDSGDNGVCNPRNYNNATWRSYPELFGYVKAKVPAKPAAAAPLPAYDFGPATYAPKAGDVRVPKSQVTVKTIAGQQVFKHNNKWYFLIGNDGSTLIGNDSGGLVGNDGASFKGIAIDRNQVSQYRSIAGGKQEFLYNGKWYLLIGNDGSTLIGNDSAGMIGNDSGGLKQVTINPALVQSWRFKNGQQEFQYGGKWYSILSNANGALKGNMLDF